VAGGGAGGSGGGRGRLETEEDSEPGVGSTDVIVVITWTICTDTIISDGELWGGRPVVWECTDDLELILKSVRLRTLRKSFLSFVSGVS